MRKTALGRDYIFGIIVYFQWLRGRTAAVICQDRSPWCELRPFLYARRQSAIGSAMKSFCGLCNPHPLFQQ